MLLAAAAVTPYRARMSRSLTLTRDHPAMTDLGAVLQLGCSLPPITNETHRPQLPTLTALQSQPRLPQQTPQPPATTPTQFSYTQPDVKYCVMFSFSIFTRISTAPQASPLTNNQHINITTKTTKKNATWAGTLNSHF